jgi:DNA polymerase IV
MGPRHPRSGDQARVTRRILHLDMDAFYASVELLRRPDLKGKPVIIGGRGEPGVERDGPYKGRGVVTTATYEARAFGIHSAMPMSRAMRLCPHAIILPTDFDEYRRMSALFKAEMLSISPVMEDNGIDEAYLDISDVNMETEEIGREIKRRVLDATRLTCSVGIAPNKLLAKMSSELQKPDGLTLLSHDDVPRRIWPLAVRKLPGVGPVTEKKLLELGLATIGDIAAQPLARLMAEFGPSHGHGLHTAAHGRDEREVVVEREPRSRSRETTFAEDTGDWQDIARTLAALAREVAADLAGEGMRGRTIGIKIRFSDFETVTRDRTVPEATANVDAIRRAAFECLSRVEIKRRVRLVGVRVGNLERALERA